MRPEDTEPLCVLLRDLGRVLLVLAAVVALFWIVL